MQLTFLGAAQTVTGSRFLLNIEGKNVLIDCGLFQGMKEIRRRNWEPFPIPPNQIDTIILTHAHIDHTGYLPLLVKNGFNGKVLCSEATRDLCQILLPDSGYLQEEEARFANKYGYSRHHPAKPLYTREDAENCLKFLRPLEFRKTYKLFNEANVTFIPAGHILGAAFVQIRHYNTNVFFSGDLGRPQDPIMHAPAVIQSADYMILESTYGDRLHHKKDPLDELSEIINRTAEQKGTVIIPAFAVGRAQHLLYLLYQLKKLKRIPDLPVYLDSPLARNATDIFRKHSDLHRLDEKLSRKVCEIAKYINSKEESKALDLETTSKIIISASGMLEGGRVLHHIRVFAPDERNTIVFAGYQAAGTRGAEMIAGKDSIRLFGEVIPVRAKIEVLSNMSAHADYEEILEWLKNFNHPPRKVFITHGEPGAAEALKQRIHERFGWTVIVPKYLQSAALG
ncbi:MAG: MBL fold metallo-hydrolase [Gammaproteobacteria bacterium]|nr:MBL fold metallo-hydrolase [Gammaproteobacteria bacterium]